MRKIAISLLLGILWQSIGISQCNVKTINRPDGVTVKYLNPELAGTGTNCELGLSVSFNGEGYLINTTVSYSSLVKKQIGTLKVQLQNNDAIVLNLYDSQLASVNGESVSVGVYLPTSRDILKLKTYPLVKVIFNEEDGTNQIININNNNNLLIRQIKCIEGSSNQI